MNDLALSDYVDLNNSKAEKASVIKMLLAFIILTIVYQLSPLISYAFKSIIVEVIFYLIIAVAIAYVGRRFAQTVKITKKPVKLGKLSLTIFTIFVVLWMLILLFNKLEVFKLSQIKIIKVLIMAIWAGIIEETLFRGLILNIFIEIFSKKKYLFIWAAIAESFCFALIHFVNLAHQSLQSTVGEVIIVFGIGLLMTYMRFASNGLVLSTIFHIYFDFQPKLAGSNYGNSNILAEFGLMVILVVIAVSAIYSYNRRYNEKQFK